VRAVVGDLPELDAGLDEAADDVGKARAVEKLSATWCSPVRPRSCGVPPLLSQVLKPRRWW